MERLESIKQTLFALLPHLTDMERGDHQLHVIKRTATDYLPEMFEKYLALTPPSPVFTSACL